MENYRAEKERLKLLADEHFATIEGQVKGVKQKVNKGIPTTLVIGGALFLLYIAGRKVFKKKTPKAFNDPSLNQLVIKRPEKESFIVRKIKEQITLFLISVMRERLTAYLSEPSNRNEPLQSIKREKK